MFDGFRSRCTRSCLRAPQAAVQCSAGDDAFLRTMLMCVAAWVRVAASVRGSSRRSQARFAFAVHTAQSCLPHCAVLCSTVQHCAAAPRRCGAKAQWDERTNECARGPRRSARGTSTATPPATARRIAATTDAKTDATITARRTVVQGTADGCDTSECACATPCKILATSAGGRMAQCRSEELWAAPTRAMQR